MAIRVNLDALTTEQENLYSRDLDLLTTERMLDIFNTEDMLVAVAVRRVLPQVARIVDACAERMKQGGRFLYVGAGTSGRLAYMDAAECPPTFGVAPDLFQVRMAGGKEAVFCAQEGMEDGEKAGADAVKEWGATEKDCVIGVASSGRTPYVLSALQTAREKGAFTALISANEVPYELAEVVVCCVTGPEALTGSTRMKAGTSAKMIMNMISTAIMIRMGRTYGNHMCYIKSTNGKLSARLVTTLRQCCDISKEEATAILQEAEGNLAVALTAALAQAPVQQAKAQLEAEGGHVRKAVQKLLKGEEA